MIDTIFYDLQKKRFLLSVYESIVEESSSEKSGAGAQSSKKSCTIEVILPEWCGDVKRLLDKILMES